MNRTVLPRSDRTGYIAITSAIVVSALVLLLVFTVSLGSYLSLNSVSVLGYKEVSQGLAEGCVEVARLNLVLNPSYPGGEDIAIGSSTCEIVSVTASSSFKTIRTQGSYQDSFTDLEVTVNPADNTLVDWREL